MREKLREEEEASASRKACTSAVSGGDHREKRPSMNINAHYHSQEGDENGLFSVFSLVIR